MSQPAKTNLHPNTPGFESGLSLDEKIVLDIERNILNWSLTQLENLRGFLALVPRVRFDDSELLHALTSAVIAADDSEATEKNIQAIIRRHEVELVEKLIGIAKSTKNDKLATDTIEKLLNRSAGKPAQAREIERDDKMVQLNFTNYVQPHGKSDAN